MSKTHHRNKNLKTIVVIITALFIISWLSIAVFSALYLNARLKYYRLKNEVAFLGKNANALHDSAKNLSAAKDTNEARALGFIQWQYVLKDQVKNARQELTDRINKAKITSSDKTLLNLLYYNLGLAYTMAVDFGNAINAFEEALQYDSKDAGSCYNLGLLYSARLQDKNKAVKYYKKYLELMPSGPNAQEARDRVEELGKR